MKTDLVNVDEQECVFENNDAYTMYELNKMYGKNTDHKPNGPVTGLIRWYMEKVGNVCSWCYPVCPKTCGVEVPQGFVGLLTRGGRFFKKLRPGLHILNPYLDKVRLVDLRSQSHSLPHQFVLSKDNVSFAIDAVINFRITSPEAALFKVKDYMKLVDNVAMAALKSTISQNIFSEILDHRERVNACVLSHMEKRLNVNGIEVNMVETQSIHLSAHLEQTLAVVVESENRIQSQINEARGDLNSSKHLVEAANLLGQNPGLALDLQAYENLHHISQHNNHTIIVPRDIFSRVHSMLEQ